MKLPPLRFKHHVTTMTLMAIAVILTGVVLWDSSKVSTGEADLRSENLIDAWRPDDVNMVDVTIGEQHVELRRERDADDELGWVLYQNGKKLDGDDLEMSQYVSNLELGLFERMIDDLDRAQAGLESPRATIIVFMGALRYTLRIGGEAQAPAGGAYVEVEGGARGKQLFVIDKELLGELLLDVTSLRSKHLAMYFSSMVESYTVGKSGKTHKLRRGGWGGGTEGAFMLEHGSTKVRASRREVNAFMKALGDVEVTRFVDVPEKDPAGALSVLIEPRAAGAPKVQLVIGDGCDKGEVLAIRREPDPVAGCLPGTVRTLLEVSSEQLTDRRVVGTAASEIMELRIEGDGSVMEVARKGEGWHMRKPSEGPTEAEPMNHLIEEMLKAEGTLVPGVNPVDVGLAAPNARVTILGLPERGTDGEEKPREEKIEVGIEVDGAVWVRRLDDGALLKVAPSAADVLHPRPTLLRSTKVIDEPMKYIRGVRLSCDGKRQKLERDLSGAWSVVEPEDAGLSVDGALASDLVDGMRQLTAVRWEAEKPRPEHALEKPWCTIALKLVETDEGEGEAREIEVHLGGETQGGYFAQVVGADPVFVAPRIVGNAARVWLLARSSLLPDMSDIDTVTLTGKDDRKLVVRKEGDVWKAEGGSEAIGQQVRAALEGLVAEIVLRRGDPAPDDGFDQPALVVTITFRSKPDESLVLKVGKSELWENTKVYLVRRQGLDWTFAVAHVRLQPLMDAL